PESAQRIGDILPDALEPRRDPDRARVFQRERHVAHVAGLTLSAVKLDFFAKLALHLALPQEVSKPAKYLHIASMTFCIAPIIRSNSLRSLASCFRPEDVSV